ncbi:glycosyltransferase [Methanobrevibacter sp.]|uniref:glycosyltransferase n=1 Tax=Methanobrevibacter sp. TaxID=66852 RepID=UPI003890D5E0
MNPLVSVIVPVYNVEEYLDDCITSLINQSFKDIEIICVDDGSIDSSLDMLNEYASKDDRIKVFSKENSGPGPTRNYGLDHACGEYVIFLDSDDWLDLDTIKILYEKAKADDLDLLVYLLEDFDDNQNKFYEEDYYNNVNFPNFFDNKIFNHRDIKKSLFTLAVSPCNKLYRRSLIEKYRIRFPENVFFEDNPFHYEVLLSSKRISIIRKHFVLRRRRENSVTSDADEKLWDVIPVSNIVLDVFKKYNLFEEYLDQVLNFKLRYIMMWYGLIEEQYKETYWKLMYDDFFKIYNDEDNHNQYLDHLTEKHKKFYLNVLESHNSKELDILILNYESDAKRNYNLRRISEEKNELNKKYRLFNAMKNDIINKNVKLTKDKKVIDEKNRILDQKYDNFEMYFAERKAYLDVRERELMDKMSEFEDFIFKKNKLLDEKQANFDVYVEEKEKYLDTRESELNDKISEFEDLMFKRENAITEREKHLNHQQIEFSKKNDLLDLREMELLELAINSNVNSLDIKPKISIILSIGNEKYLGQCLDSLSNQTLKNIEILCIDNDSSDNSLEILKEFTDKDSRFKVLAQKNQSNGKSKNMALNNVSGEFILFLDSNEFLEQNACESLYMDAKLNNLDMLIFPIDGNSYDNYLKHIGDNQAIDHRQLVSDLFKLSPNSCQIYKKGSLGEIHFLEDVSFEDVPFFWEVLLSSERISLINEQYAHRHLEDDVEMNEIEVINLSNIVFDLFKKYDIQNEFNKDIINYKVHYIYQKYINSNEDYKQDFWLLIKDDYSKIKQDSALHEEYMKNLDDNNKRFYTHVLQSRSAVELDYLEKYEDII